MQHSLQSGTHGRPPLQRIWSQHVVLHRAVQELEKAMCSVRSDEALRDLKPLLSHIASILPEHFALEEQGGYFADVLSVAPHFAGMAADLQAEHELLIPSLHLILAKLDQPQVDRDQIVEEIESFVRAIHDHEDGETELVRSAFRGNIAPKSA